MNRFFNLYLRTVTDYPRTVLLFLFLLLIALAAGLPNFKLDASAESLTLEHDTDLDFYREMSKRYDSGDYLIVTFKPKAELFSEESLSTLISLKKSLAGVEGVESVNSILDVPLLYSPKQTLAEMASSPRTLLTEGTDWQQAKAEFWNSPIYKNLILGPDGQTTALQLNIKVDTTYLSLVSERDQLKQKSYEPDFSESDAQHLEKVTEDFLAYRTEAEARSRLRVEQVRSIVDKYKGSAELFVGGVAMIAADMIAFIQSDLVVFGIAVVLFMIVVLAIIFRSIKFVVIPMVCCLTAVVMMLGYVSWLDWRLTVISSNFVALLLIISLSIIIHLVVRFREFENKHPEWSIKELVIATVKNMARPCFYTAITTIVAFVSLVVSDIRPVIDFGWMMTIGLVVALSLAFLILPAALMLLPKSKTTVVTKRKERTPLTAYFSRAVESSGSIILTIAVLIFCLSVWGISQLRVENRFVDYFHESTEINRGLTVIDNNLGGTISLDIVIDARNEETTAEVNTLATDDPFVESSGLEGFDNFDDEFDEGFEDEFDDFGADDPFSEHTDNITSYWMTLAGLRQIEWLHDYLEEQPEIGKVQSLATMYKVGLDINGSLSDFELALMQKALSPDVRNVLISPYLSPDGLQARLTMRVIDTYPGLNRSELVTRIEDHIAAVGVLRPENTKFTGLLVLYNNMLQSLFSSQILTLGVVFVAIYLMLAILFKSIYMATIAIVPNILAALSVLGVMGILSIPLDMMTITIAAITVGIGVDHTIHYIHRFTSELARDRDYIAAMHRSHSSIGTAMYYTAIIIIFGFGIMVLSRFIPTIYFGLLTGFAMFASLMGSLMLLPKLVVTFKPIRLP